MLGQQEMNTRMERKTRKAEDVCALPMWSRKTRLTSNQDISSFTMPHQQAQNLLTFIIPTVQLGRATTSNVWMISLFRQTRILGLVIVQFGAQLGRDTMNGMRIFLGLEALSEGVVQQAHNLWTFIILTVQLGRATTSNVWMISPFYQTQISVVVLQCGARLGKGTMNGMRIFLGSEALSEGVVQ